MKTILLCCVVSSLFGCSALPPINSQVSDCDTHPSGWCKHSASQSWDQQNLHQQARLMVCADRYDVFETDGTGVLAMCE
jgi:hypothetical protein